MEMLHQFNRSNFVNSQASNSLTFSNKRAARSTNYAQTHAGSSENAAGSSGNAARSNEKQFTIVSQQFAAISMITPNKGVALRRQEEGHRHADADAGGLFYFPRPSLMGTRSFARAHARKKREELPCTPNLRYI